MIDSVRWGSLALECLIGFAVVTIGIFGMLEPTSTERLHLSTRIDTIEAKIESDYSRIAELDGLSSEIERLRARLEVLGARVSTIDAPDSLARSIRDAAVEHGLVIVSDTAWTPVVPESDEEVDTVSEEPSSAGREVQITQRAMQIVGPFEATGRFVDWLESHDAALEVVRMEIQVDRNHDDGERWIATRLFIRWSRWDETVEEDA